MRSDDPRERLLEAAGEVFAEKGFKGGTVREIIQRAEVNLGAVNYYFRDKEGLYIDAVKAAACGPAEQFPVPDWPTSTPPSRKLADFIRAQLHLAVGRENPGWQRRLMMMELANPTPACAELVSQQIRPRAELLGAILRELLPEVTSEKRNLVAHSIVGQCVFHRLAQPIVSLLVGEEEYRRYDADRLAEHIIDFSFAALGLRPPVGQSHAMQPVDGGAV
jgi:TetR/AcrR family transcriptional regulator, regulator of cefoperazone and chloramphenicol sensitivity